MSTLAAFAYDEEGIFDHLVSKMSEEDKTFTDPIHHDILINHLETRVVDTTSFQKLRKARQLGTAHLVYHGAEHSRFGHSLGALHMASKLIACVKGNRFSEITVFSSNADNNKASRQDRAFSLVTRLAALLHDLTVIPFSHTLEKEGNLFEPQWEDRRIIPRLIAPQSEIYRKVADYARLLIEEAFKNIGDSNCGKYAQCFANTVLGGALKVIKFSSDPEKMRQTNEYCEAIYGQNVKADLETLQPLAKLHLPKELEPTTYVARIKDAGRVESSLRNLISGSYWSKTK